MAKTTTVTVSDDLDGTKDATEYSFSYDGNDYTIDLAKKNKAALDKALKPYLDAATKVGRSGGTKRRKTTTAASRGDMAQIRTWAQENGIEVSDRGRVPAAVVEQFDAAH